MSKKILGLDLGTNSVGWALLETDRGNKPCNFIDLGVRIFIKAVKEDKFATPKNVKRRQSRLMRRVIQRRARRKKKMLRYLVKLGFLPEALRDSPQPEVLLNKLGDPYELRAKALREPLSAHELGRVLLHLVQRRGFLSNKKRLLGTDMQDDPDVQAVLEEMREDEPDTQDEETINDSEEAKEAAKEEKEFKEDIKELRRKISEAGRETLGEYLFLLSSEECKRNRIRAGGRLRTDRKMYQEELDKIWERQKKYHPVLNDEMKEDIQLIIFHQRPIKLRSDRVGKCSVENNYRRCRMGRLESQQFRYLQDINHLRLKDPERNLNREEREKLWELFETDPNPSITKIRKKLNLDIKKVSDVKKFKGNRTACAIRGILPQWDEFSTEKQYDLVEDLITIQKKSALKRRLVNHWKFDGKTAVRLCMLEFEDGHANHSSKAIKKMLPYLREGMIYSDARKAAGYSYDTKEEEQKKQTFDRLGLPPDIPNPIVQKGLHELRRVINAIIAEHGKPDVIRIEMARELEMNTKRYRKRQRTIEKQQKENMIANDEAAEAYKTIKSRNPNLPGLSEKFGKYEETKYRLWKEQNHCCVYSGKSISNTAVFTEETEIDHIVPRSQSWNNSYMNKVLCYTAENRYKSNHIPEDAFSNDPEKWEKIKRNIARWDKKLDPKRKRFYRTGAQSSKEDFINSQLNDTRYIGREAGQYLRTLGVDVTFTRGMMTSWLRHCWGLNNLVGDSEKKDRTSHFHHAIDAAVTACIDRGFYQRLLREAELLEKEEHSESKKLKMDPPWKNFRSELNHLLQDIIISHASQIKISGQLHEETGAGYIEGIGTVYRRNLDSHFKHKHIDEIIDPAVKEQVRSHFSKYKDKAEGPFAKDTPVYHKDVKTPIKRVRVRQAFVKDLRKLEEDKFGVRDQQGKPFRWMTYGNLHHVEIIRHKQKDGYKGVFVNTMEAAHRVRNVKDPVIQKDHGDDYEFITALHINDMVRIQRNGKWEIYRVQAMESIGTLILRAHAAATLKNPKEKLRKSISTLMSEYQMQKVRVNAIGKLLDDQTHN